MPVVVVPPQKRSGFKIYLIGVLKIVNDDIIRIRCWGFERDREKAEECVMQNMTDMFEAGYYNYGVVEECEEGLLPACTTKWWYKATYEPGVHDPRVCTTEEPEIAKNSTGFFIG